MKKIFSSSNRIWLCAAPYFPAQWPPMGTFALIDIILLAITRLTVELELWFSKQVLLD